MFTVAKATGGIHGFARVERSALLLLRLELQQ